MKVAKYAHDDLLEPKMPSSNSFLLNSTKQTILNLNDIKQRK